MEKSKKKTKRVAYGELLKLVEGNEELTNFINHEIELLNNKKSKSGQTKTQKDNEGYRNLILQVLKDSDKPLTITQIQEANEVLAGHSNQKMSALLKPLVDNEIIVKTKDKKQTLFSINKGE